MDKKALNRKEETPLFSKFSKKGDLKPEKRKKRIEIDFYRTYSFESYPFYRPISKIIKINE